MRTVNQQLIDYLSRTAQESAIARHIRRTNRRATPTTPPRRAPLCLHQPRPLLILRLRVRSIAGGNLRG